MAPYLSAPALDDTTTFRDAVGLKETLPPHVPPTKLPFLDTAARSTATELHGSRLNGDNEARFTLSSNRQLIVKGVRSVLERFALFVGTLTELENVGFVADIPSHDKASAGKVAVDAVIRRPGISPSSENEVDLTFIEGEYVNESLDFAIRILPESDKRGENASCEVCLLFVSFPLNLETVCWNVSVFRCCYDWMSILNADIYLP
jgi:hypothetical protein